VYNKEVVMARLSLIAVSLAWVAACDDMTVGNADDGYGGGPIGGDDDGTMPGDDDGTTPRDDDPPEAARQGRLVYVMTNAAEGNEVVALEHLGREVLELGRFDTGGLGTGTAALPTLEVTTGVDPLVSQGSLHRAGDYLLAANAGSGSVTIFRVEGDGSLTLIDVEQVGAYPNAIASHDDRVFVAMSPGPDATGGVAVLRMDDQGELTADGAILPLATPGSHPADLLVSEDGAYLVVTELLDDSIAVWPLASDGEIGEPTRTPSAGPGPFGMDTVGDVLIVTEAAPTVPNGSSTSSYRIGPRGALVALDAAIPTEQTAACWVVTTPDDEHAIVSNTESGTLTTWRVGDSGLELVRGAAREPGGAPIDLALTEDGRYLYVLQGGAGELVIYQLRDRIRLVVRTDHLDLPSLGTQGLVAW
jgi:6-phosphogluconolactonase